MAGILLDLRLDSCLRQRTLHSQAIKGIVVDEQELERRPHDP
ncbi:MAG TPA: hypothetical protein VGJ75_22695 [Dongiaceae bacterium]